MKKIILILMLIGSSITSYSQIKKGDFQIGGTISINNERTKDFNSNTNYQIYSSTSYSIMPSISISLTDRLMGGVSTGFQNHVFSREWMGGWNGPELRKENHYARLGFIGAFLRHNTMLTENFYFYIQPQISAGFGKSTSDRQTGNSAVVPNKEYSSLSTVILGVSPGIIYYFGNFGIEANLNLLNYAFQKSVEKHEEMPSRENPYFVNSGFNLNNAGLFSFGIQYNISR
jgi:hypothetical protein